MELSFGQRTDPENGLIEPWFTNPSVDVIKTWDLSNKVWLEFGSGRSTAWLRKKCKWVDTIEANNDWAVEVASECIKHNLSNGELYYQSLNEGVQDTKHIYFGLIPENKKYDIISVDGIWRTECMQWAADHFKGRNGIIIADNWHQDYVWISPLAEEIMSRYGSEIYPQPNHTDHEGNCWKTAIFYL